MTLKLIKYRRNKNLHIVDYLPQALNARYIKLLPFHYDYLLLCAVANNCVKVFSSVTTNPDLPFSCHKCNQIFINNGKITDYILKQLKSPRNLWLSFLIWSNTWSTTYYWKLLLPNYELCSYFRKNFFKH